MAACGGPGAGESPSSRFGGGGRRPLGSVGGVVVRPPPLDVDMARALYSVFPEVRIAAQDGETRAQRASAYEHPLVGL